MPARLGWAVAALLVALARAGPADASNGADTAHASPQLASSVVVLAAADDLGPSTAPPWNPEDPVTRRRAWEQVVLFPGRFATMPLTGLGRLLDRGLLYVEETALVPKLTFVSREFPSRTGLRIRSTSPAEGSGIGGRAEYRAAFLGGSLKNFVGLSHAASTGHYHLTRVDVLGGGVGLFGLSSLEYGYGWLPGEPFYGIGMTTPERGRSDYASQTEHVRATLGYGWNMEARSRRMRTQVASWIGPRSATTSRGRRDDRVSVELRHPETVAATLDERFEHLIYGVRFASDWRGGEPHWAEGWRMLLQSERYDGPVDWLALHTSRAGAQFTRTAIELEGGWSFLRDPRTLRLYGGLVDQHVSGGAEHMMLADLARLGGRIGLGGFQPGRFHDLDLIHARVSWIFPLVRRFEMDLHVATGQVSPDVWQAARFDRLEQSYGFALRGRSKSRPIGSAGFDFSRESIRFRYTFGNPERDVP